MWNTQLNLEETKCRNLTLSYSSTNWKTWVECVSVIRHFVKPSSRTSNATKTEGKGKNHALNLLNISPRFFACFKGKRYSLNKMAWKLRLPLSNVRKYKTRNTPKTVNIFILRFDYLAVIISNADNFSSITLLHLFLQRPFLNMRSTL